MQCFLKIRWLGFLLAQAVLLSSHAGPQRLSDQELSDVVGQAFINMSTFSDGGIDYSRVNFGGQVDVQFNVKNVSLGTYPRSYGAGNYLSGADLDFSNLAMGSVDDATGAVTPFKIKDPFIEFAYKANKVVGLRLGLGEANGLFSGDLTSFSGNFNFRMQGTGQELINAACKSSIAACVGTLLAVDRSALFAADGRTVNYDHDKGGVASARANYVGLVNGTQMQRLNSDGSTYAAPALSLFSAQGCAFVDMSVCFPNTNFQSFQVGSAANPAKNVFISLQSQDLAWRDDKGRMLMANSGVFFNVPKTVNASGVEVPPITISFAQIFGIARQNTCFGPLTKGC